MERTIPRPGEKYIHFKKKAYQVICIANHSETGEKMVVYQALYGDFSFYVRPLVNFISEVDHEKYPDVAQKYRFELAEDIKRNAPEDEKAKDLKINLHHIKVMDLNGEEHAPLQEEQEVTEEQVPDPILLRFLDAETYQEKREVLKSVQNRMTDRLIDDFAVILDVVIPENDINTRLRQLDTCLATMQRYQTERLR